MNASLCGPGRDARASRTAYRITCSATGMRRTRCCKLEDALDAHDLARIGLVRARRGRDDLLLLDVRRVSHRDVEHEPIELRFRERIRSLELDRILGREHEERERERIGLSSGRHSILLHRLEERGLRLRRRPVDLVREDHVREERPADELEGALSGHLVVLEDLGPGDVGRHEVGRELDPAELEIQDLRERRDEERLRKSGDADEKAVAVGEEHREELLDHGVLTHDDLPQLGEDFAPSGLQFLEKLNVAHGSGGLRHGSVPRVCPVRTGPVFPRPYATRDIMCITGASASYGVS
jgi:hypothetical protein